MHGHGQPELAKKLNDKIPKTVYEMFERVRAFNRGEVVAGSVEMVRPSQRDKGYVRPAWPGMSEKSRNRGGPTEAQRNMGVSAPYPRKDTFTPLIKTPKEILATESVSFLEPPPLIGNPEKQNLNKLCDYHGDRGRTGMRILEAVGSTIHFMIKFPTNQGVWRQREEQISRIKEQAILRTRSNSGRRPGLGLVLLEKTRSKEDIEEVFTISHERPDQYVTVGATLTTNCKQLLVDILQENMEVFAWTKPESTAVSRFVMEHQLKIYPLVEPVVHKRRPVAPKGRLALKERVFHWLGEGLIRKVRHPEWITNPIPIKLANRTWKLQIDYSSLNKACSKDMYPFTEEKEELASLMGYPYKCFLRLPKEYNQIRMAEDDEEKTGFHTEEGVYCFTYMLKELKNSAATL
ncbi:hypothetical protein Tco_0033879 [Tanacetum coccineum]